MSKRCFFVSLFLFLFFSGALSLFYKTLRVQPTVTYCVLFLLLLHVCVCVFVCFALFPHFSCFVLFFRISRIVDFSFLFSHLFFFFLFFYEREGALRVRISTLTAASSERGWI